jgi:membrane protein DedA with SNARE-associated domain
MSLAQFLADYGYLAVLAGSLLEGETILVMAGFAAHQGYLSMPAVVAVAFVGGTLGDLGFFWIGRRFGAGLLRRLPGAGPRAAKVLPWLHRFDALLIVAIRFMYGLRIIGPIVIGAAGVRPARFALYNAIGAAIWAPLVGGAGYFFGYALQELAGDLWPYEEVALAVIAAIMLGGGLILGRTRARPAAGGRVSRTRGRS